MKILKLILLSTGGAAVTLGATARAVRTQVYIPVPTPVLYHGAISYSQTRNLSSGSFNASSRLEAESIALNACLENGIKDCSIVMYLRNTCGALAASPDGSFGAARNNSLDIAERQALEKCRELGGRDCKPKQAFCSNGR